MKQHKLLLLSNMYPSQSDPTYGTFVKNIDDSLSLAGFDISRVIMTNAKKSAVLKLFKYFHFILWGFIRLMLTRRTVYLHYVAHSSVPLLLALIFRRFLIVAHVHGGDALPTRYEPKLLKKCKLWLSKKALKRSNLIIVPSHFFKSLLTSEFDIDPKLIHISPSGGVNTEQFTPQFCPPRRKHRDYLALGYVGRLDKGKGVDTLLDGLAKTDAQFRCLIVGGGTEEARLQQKASELGLMEKIDFCGRVPHQNLPEYYSKIDFFVFPSEMEESLGLVGLEAMACGKPLFSTMMGGMSEYQVEGENTFVFEVGNSASLAQVLMTASNVGESEYVSMSQNARETAMKFDSKRVSNKLCLIFEKL